jgi:hypothetical protein
VWSGREAISIWAKNPVKKVGIKLQEATIVPIKSCVTGRGLV